MGRLATFQEIWEKLGNCKNVAMTLHYGPDGDSLGSNCAMKYLLEKKLGVNVTLVSYDSLSSTLKDLPFVKEIEFGRDISELNHSEFDLILFLDSGDAAFQSGKLHTKFKVPENTYSITIDHHETNTLYGTLNYVNKTAPSTCSVLIDMCRELNINIDQELANRLMVGVCTDSGFFTFDTNAEKAIKDASFLIDCGADYLKGALTPILYNQPLYLKKYFAHLFEKLKIDAKLKVGYSSISKEEIAKLGINEAEIRLGPNELQFIGECKAIFTLAEMDNHIKGSFRSKKGIDVSVYAKALGGGGHKPAASFSLPLMPLNEAENKVLETIRKIGIN